MGHFYLSEQNTGRRKYISLAQALQFIKPVTAVCVYIYVYIDTYILRMYKYLYLFSYTNEREVLICPELRTDGCCYWRDEEAQAT